MNSLFKLLLFLITAGLVNAQAPLVEKTFDKKSGSKLSLKMLTSGLPPAGYIAVQAEVTNKTKIPRSFSFDFESIDSNFSNTGNSVSTSEKLFCPPLKNVRQTFIVPIVSSFHNSSYSDAIFKVEGSGSAMAPFAGQNNSSLDENWPSILIGSQLHTKNGSILDKEVDLSLGSSHSVSTFGHTFDATNMPEDWRCYIGHDLIFLTDQEWLKLSPGSRNAILKWISHGGHLRIFSESNANPKSLNLPEGNNPSWGGIKILPLPSTGLIPNPAALVKEIKGKLSKQKGPYRMSHQRSDFRNAWHPQTSFGKKAFNVIFFVLVLIAFAVLVGPVNLFVFAKAGERHKLFITTPIISAIASLLLLILIFFQDGFGGKGTRLLLIETNPTQGSNSSHVVQEQFSRTGVLLSTGFSLKEPALISPVLIYNILSADQKTDLSGDWFQSRSEQGHLIETIRPSRERLEISGTADAPSISSTFSYPIDLLYYRDDSGKYWRAENLSNKKKIKLTPSIEKHAKDWALKKAKKYSTRQRKRIERSWQRKNHFIATAKKAPGIDTLKSIKWNTSTIITGPISK